MKVVITGITGFVGQNLSKYLEKKDLIVEGVSLRNNNWRSNLDMNANAIIHLAGKAHDTENTSSEEIYFKINRDLTIELFEQFLNSNIRDFFYFSSVKAVADTVNSILTEDSDSHPLTPYGKSKHEAEDYILSKNIPASKRVFIIRPCMIHGPGNKGNLNLLYKVVERGVPWPLANFENRRSFLSIDNLSFLIYAMLDKSDLRSGIFNFSDDESLSTNQIVSLIGGILEKNVRLLNIPKGIIKNVARIGNVLPFPLNSERLKKLTESYIVSNNKIKQALGLQSLPLSAEEGLKITLKSFNQVK